jgi:hypothetical protein
LLFFEHDEVSDFHLDEEGIEKDKYIRELMTKSYSDFAPSFLNIPSFDDKYYADKFWSIIINGIMAKKILSFTIAVVLAIFIGFQFKLGFWGFLTTNLEWIWGFFKPFHPS